MILWTRTFEMRTTATWIGRLLVGAGVLLIGAHVLLAYYGITTSINFGDTDELQFTLVPVWQMGLVIAAMGAAIMAGARVFRA